MFAKENRLKNKKDIQRVLHKGVSARARDIGMKSMKSQNEHTRFCVVVSKKVSKKAVERNKVKRRIREAVKKRLPLLPPGYDMVLIAYPSSLNKTSGELHEQVEHLFAKQGMFPV